jgi:two-component system sensor histidine kinase DesK
VDLAALEQSVWRVVAVEEQDRGVAGPWGNLWPLLWIIFLPNLAVPVSELLHAHPSPLRLSLVLAGAALFVTAYLWAGWHSDLSRVVYPVTERRLSDAQQWGPILLLVMLSILLCLGDGTYWLCLLIFTAASAGARFPLRQAARLVAGLAVLAALLGWLAHDSVSDLGSAAFWTVMSGLLTIVIKYLRRANRDLQVAREEIARLAVEAERLRFARDLHDLLGHHLARIALQSEVAETLAPTATEQAVAAMHEVGSVARTALQEVRAAVAGYRQPSLAGEVRGAKELLAASGIGMRYEGVQAAVPPAVEAVLAWAVREGVTNVVKHSRARTCTIRFISMDGLAGIEVADDGPGARRDGAQPALGTGGSGLAGLAERAAALDGRCEAGPSPDGGFVLSVVLPVVRQRAPEARAGSPMVEPALAGPALRRP